MRRVLFAAPSAVTLIFVVSSSAMFDSRAMAADRTTGRSWATRSEVIARQGMVATSHPLATQIGLRVLEAGGTAVDAAIAANAALGLMEPTGNGIGGDLFAIVWDPNTRKPFGLNGSGRSPKSLTLEHLKAQKLEHIPPYGPLPVTVPGTVDGWFELHKKFGKLPMARILAPAIAHAKEGFPVTEVIAHHWAASVPRLAQFENFKETFTIDGRAPKKGEIFKNPRLARTLEKIAAGGRDAFYRGEIAAAIAAHMKKHGGFLGAEDLAAHTSEWVEPVSVDYRGYRVWELPPNTQGVAALEMLAILEGFDLRAMGFASADYVHVFTEAKKLAFEDRARYFADPAFAKISTSHLYSDQYAAERRKLIKMGVAAKAFEPGALAIGASGGTDTIYLTTADKSGMMVSLIQSNYRGMGSGVTPGELGFILQDRGELFSLEPGHANVYAPGKRPFHTIIPALITKDGQALVSFGVMGGDMQPQGHVQIVVNLIDFGMSLQEAGDAPRIYHTGSSEPTGEQMKDGGSLNLESEFPADTVQELVRRGHDVRAKTAAAFGGYQAIRREGGVYYGASESRKDGQAAGY